MFVKQLSVFIENREGRLEQVTEVLMNEDINILSLSMADTAEYGVLRMIVSDPERAKAALCAKGLSARLTDVLAVKIEDHAGELHRVTHILCGLRLNIEYMYALQSAGKRAVIVKTSNGEAAGKALAESGLELFEGAELYR